jgi:hypothetical protein
MLAHQCHHQHWVLPFSILTVTADIGIAGSLCILLHSRRTGYHGCASAPHSRAPQRLIAASYQDE